MRQISIIAIVVETKYMRKIFFFTDDNLHLPLPACKNVALSTIDALNRSSVDVEQTHQTCFFYYWLREGEFPLPIDAGGNFQFPNYYYWLARRLQLVQGCFISQVVHQHEEPGMLHFSTHIM